MKISLTVNGRARTIDVDPQMPLLWALRDELELKGTKYGCGRGYCGSCTVHLNGQATRSCTLPVQVADGAKVTTIEGLAESAAGKAVQQAWIDLDVVQCGWCQPGQCMAAAGLLASKPSPKDADIDQALGGNLCRCGTYQRIRAAVKQAGQALAKEKK
jgi:isoquinoline 1-oxidoreductase alpha subunit